MSSVKHPPDYVCVYYARSSGKNQNDYKLERKHSRGPMLGIREGAIIFGCQRCGLVYWEPVEVEKSNRCHGMTVKDARCKLPALRNSLFCSNHAHLQDAIFSAMTADLPGFSGKDES